MPVGYVNEGRSHGFVLVLSCRVRIALSLNKEALEPKLALFLEKGEYSLSDVRSIIASYS